MINYNVTPLPRNEYTYSDMEDLWEAVAHGDEEHRTWLRAAIFAWYEQLPIPQVYGKGTKEKQIELLQAEILRLRMKYEHFE